MALSGPTTSTHPGCNKLLEFVRLATGGMWTGRSGRDGGMDDEDLSWPRRLGPWSLNVVYVIFTCLGGQREGGRDRGVDGEITQTSKCRSAAVLPPPSSPRLFHYHLYDCCMSFHGALFSSRTLRKLLQNTSQILCWTIMSGSANDSLPMRLCPPPSSPTLPHSLSSRARTYANTSGRTIVCVFSLIFDFLSTCD